MGSVSSESELKDSIVRALAIELKVSYESILSARSLRDEFKMDSIAAVNVAFAVEEEFGIEIEINEGDRFDSVDDIVGIVRRSLGLELAR